MNRGMLFPLVNVSVVAGLLFAVSDVVAQQQQPTSGPRLVTTQCGFGQETGCGTKNIGQQCVYVFDLQGDRSGAFGFNFGGYRCSGGTTMTVYKDFDPSRASGTCVILRYPPTDATRTGDEGDYPQLSSGEDEVC